MPITIDLVGTPFEVGGDVNWFPESLARGTFLERLNLHYMEYLLRLRPTEATRVMEDWAARVPPYTRGYWRDSWNSYALSIRVVTWLDILTLHRAGLAALTVAALEQSIAAQVRFLERNLETDIGGNHLMKNLRALLRAGSCFQGQEPRRWVRRSLEHLDAELGEQILPDGMHFELSPAYHLQVMEDLLDMRRSLLSLENAAGEPKGCAKARRNIDVALGRMAEIVRLTTHPDGLPSLFADGGLHMATEPHRLLACLEAEQILPRSSGAPAPGSWRLAHGGYVGLRGPDELFIVDCGEVGAAHLPAHGHGDALSMEWSVCGRRFLIDPGVYEYHSGPRRAYSRSTAAHNTVTLDDYDQSEFWSAFRVGNRAHTRVERWEPTPHGFVLTASHDGYRRMAGAPTHARRIAAALGRITIVDEVRGGAGQQVRSRILFAPEVTIDSITEVNTQETIARVSMAAIGPAGRAVRARIRSSVPIRSEPADYSPDFGRIVPTTRLVLELGEAPCTATWSIEVE